MPNTQIESNVQMKRRVGKMFKILLSALAVVVLAIVVSAWLGGRRDFMGARLGQHVSDIGGLEFVYTIPGEKIS